MKKQIECKRIHAQDGNMFEQLKITTEGIKIKT